MATDIAVAIDSAPLIHCAPEGSLRYQLARLTSLVRSPIQAGRQPHFEALLQSAELRVREAALGALIDGGIPLPTQMVWMAGWCVLASVALAMAARRIVSRESAARTPAFQDG